MANIDQLIEQMRNNPKNIRFGFNQGLQTVFW